MPLKSCSPLAVESMCVYVVMDLEGRGVRWMWMTVNPTPADWAAALMDQMPSPVSAHLE